MRPRQRHERGRQLRPRRGQVDGEGGQGARLKEPRTLLREGWRGQGRVCRGIGQDFRVIQATQKASYARPRLNRGARNESYSSCTSLLPRRDNKADGVFQQPANTSKSG